MKAGGQNEHRTAVGQRPDARVRPGGFEPPTCGLRVHCSAIELEAPDDSSRTGPPRCQPLSGSRGQGKRDRPAILRDGRPMLGVTEGIRTPDIRDHNAAL